MGWGVNKEKDKHLTVKHHEKSREGERRRGIPSLMSMETLSKVGGWRIDV